MHGMPPIACLTVCMDKGSLESEALGIDELEPEGVYALLLKRLQGGQ